MHVLSITRVKLGVSLILGNAFIWVHSEGELWPQPEKDDDPSLERCSCGGVGFVQDAFPLLSAVPFSLPGIRSLLSGDHQA
jgi:hypothetical protein